MFFAILIGTAGCDQATKQIAQSALGGVPTISLAADIVRLELVQNTGAFLSLGASLPEWARHTLLIGFVPVLLILLCSVLLRSGLAQKHQLIGLGLLAGGGFGNWIDRMFHAGAVTDFVSVGIGPLRTGIFNAADVAVILGVVLLVFEGSSFRRASDRLHGPAES